jgi:Sulfotransferase domain
MKPPVVHIGYHKTGTTFLQKKVFNSRNKGFLATWTVDTGDAIQNFVLTHPKRFHPEQVREKFLATLDDNTLVPVISHEDLCGYPVYERYYGFEAAKNIHATLPEAKIIISVREQKSAIRSLYGQYVRQDGQWPLRTFIGTGTEPAGFMPIFRLDHFEYHLLIQHYIELFGQQNVLVLPFERLLQSPIEFEQSIHDFAGSGGVAEQVMPPALVGFGAATLSILRRSNHFVKRPPDWNGDWSRVPFVDKARERLIDFVDPLIPKPVHDKCDQKLREFITERVSGYYVESNNLLNDMCGGVLNDLGYEL